MVVTALFVLVAGMGVAAAQETVEPSYPPTTPPTTVVGSDVAGAGAGQTAAQGGLPRTGSSSSIPTAVVAVGMVAVGTALVVAARRRSAHQRS